MLPSAPFCPPKPALRCDFVQLGGWEKRTASHGLSLCAHCLIAWCPNQPISCKSKSGGPHPLTPPLRQQT